MYVAVAIKLTYNNNNDCIIYNVDLRKSKPAIQKYNRYV